MLRYWERTLYLITLSIVTPWPGGGGGGGRWCQAVRCVPVSGGCGCVFDDGSGTIDVSSLSNNDGTPKFKDIQGPKNQSYSYSPCKPFNEGSCLGAAVCQVSADRGRFMQIGDADTVDWSLPGVEGSNITVYYQHEHPGPPPVLRESFVTYICDLSATTAKMEVIGADTDSYYFTLTTMCACPNACSSGGDSGAQDLSAGSIVLIVFVVAVFVYVAGGMLFKRTQRHASGIDMLPNISFWRTLPRRLQDGFLFVTCRLGGQRNSFSYTEVK